MASSTVATAGNRNCIQRALNVGGQIQSARAPAINQISRLRHGTRHPEGLSVTGSSSFVASQPYMLLLWILSAVDGYLDTAMRPPPRIRSRRVDAANSPRDEA